jgi:hypothetical protein
MSARQEISYTDFLTSCKKYHKAADSRYVAQNYIDVVNDRKIWDNLQYVTVDILEREMFSKYLFAWGKMNRCFPKNKREMCYKSLLETMRDSAETIQSLKEVRIESANLDANYTKEKIETLYGKFKDFCHKENKSQPTASAKILHILLPKLFMIWDQKFVRSQQRLRPDSASYVKYLSTKQTQINKLLESFRQTNPSGNLATLVEDIEAQHHKFLTRELNLEEPANEPFTKLLDEYQVVKYSAKIR